MTKINGQIDNLSEKISAEVLALRREIHQHPELGFQEVKTAKKVANYLEKLGLHVETEVAKTGVVGILEGAHPGPVLALRADMDALPITEKTGYEYASQLEGKMHACGHDSHTAMLLGAAHVLSLLKTELKGTVKFIFQPAEEGPGGALPMIEAGVLKNPDVEAIFGLHVWPDFQLGQIGLGYGAVMAAPDQFELKIIGQGGHGSAPHETIDAITVAAQVVNGLQQIVSRQIIPIQPAVLTIGTINGGYRYNIIADEVTMTGTVRTLSAKVREEIPKRMEEIIRGITSAFGAKYEFAYKKLYPPLVNHEKMVEYVKQIGRQVLGSEGVQVTKDPVMGGEDFAYFLEKVPGAFFRLGSSNGTPETSYPLHHPQFNIDEKTLVYGVKMLSQLIFNYES